MDMREVKSSQIAKIGYDPQTRTLEVHFARGGRYHYDDVPASAHDALIAAEGIGAHFYKHIRSGGFKYRRLDDE